MNEEDKKVLVGYLYQYCNCRTNVRILKKRLLNIVNEMKNPLCGIRYTPTPKSQSKSEGSASLTIRQSEIEERIIAQQKEAERKLTNIMDIMDYLEENSKERVLMEMRYIDCMAWQRIGKELHYSRSQCDNIKNAALEELLSFDRVKEIIIAYAEKEERLDTIGH